MTKVEELTREAVKDVFKQMLGIEVNAEPPAPLPSDPLGQIIGSVGFIGDATGIIFLYAGVTFAVVMTGKMLGLDEKEVDTHEMVNDAIGEISNMVVGHVKSHLCDAGLPCTLTIPSVVRGQELSVEGSAQTSRKTFGFRNCNHNLMVEIRLKEPVTS